MVEQKVKFKKIAILEYEEEFINKFIPNIIDLIEKKEIVFDIGKNYSSLGISTEVVSNLNKNFKIDEDIIPPLIADVLNIYTTVIRDKTFSKKFDEKENKKLEIIKSFINKLITPSRKAKFLLKTELFGNIYKNLNWAICEVQNSDSNIKENIKVIEINIEWTNIFEETEKSNNTTIKCTKEDISSIVGKLKKIEEKLK